jgi:hypothetical protein
MTEAEQRIGKMPDLDAGDVVWRNWQLRLRRFVTRRPGRPVRRDPFRPGTGAGRAERVDRGAGRKSTSLVSSCRQSLGPAPARQLTRRHRTTCTPDSPLGHLTPSSMWPTTPSRKMRRFLWARDPGNASCRRGARVCAGS